MVISTITDVTLNTAAIMRYQVNIHLTYFNFEAANTNVDLKVLLRYPHHLYYMRTKIIESKIVLKNVTLSPRLLN